MAQHEEGDVEEQGPNWGSFGWGRRNKEFGDLQPQHEESGALRAGGAGPCFPQAAFLTPKCLCANKGYREYTNCFPSTLHASPRAPKAAFQQPQSIPGLPPVPWKVRALSEFHHMQMQSPYLGLGADTSPLPGREPGQGRPRGALRAVPGSGSSVPHAGNTPHLGCTCMCHA